MLLFYNSWWLYTLQLHNSQLSSSEKSLAGKKIHPGSYRFRFLLHRSFFSFSLTNACFPCWLRKAYALLWAAIRFVGSETPKHNAFDQFQNLNFISSIFQEKHDFLVLTDPVIICIYLRTTGRYVDQQIRPPTLKRPSSHLKVAKMFFFL